MKSSLLATAMAVAFLMVAAPAGRSIARTIEADDITAPLICAMAHSGACDSMVAAIQQHQAIG